MLADPIDQAMVEAIHRVAKLMDIETVAEHVENDETLVMLRNLGIDHAQGFFLSNPQPLSSIQATAIRNV